MLLSIHSALRSLAQSAANAVANFVANNPTINTINLSWSETNPSLAHSAKMVVIGSSTFFGREANPISNSVINKLDTYFKSQYQNFVTVNGAISGQSSYHLLPANSGVANRPNVNTSGNVTWAIAQNPSFVLIGLPSNDTADGYTNEEYLTNLQTITNALRVAGIQFFITTTQPRNTNAYVTQQLGILAQIIRDTYGSNVLEYYTPLVNPATGQIASNLDAGDGTHVGNTGHQLLFDNSWPKIQAYIESTIKNDYYRIERLVSGSWSVLVNNVSKYLTSYVLSGLTTNTVYTLRVGAVTRGTGSISYSGQVTLATLQEQVTPPAPTSQRILLDFGGADSVNAVSTDVAPDGKKWNTVLNAAVRNSPWLWGNAFVDINNVAADGLILKASQDGGGTYAAGGLDSMNPDGYASPVGDYPASATRDSHYIHPSSGLCILTITVPSGKKITSLKVWGSRLAAGPRILQMKKAADQTWQEYEAAANSTYTQALTLTDIPAGANTIHYQCKSGSSFAYIGIMDIILESV